MAEVGHEGSHVHEGGPTVDRMKPGEGVGKTLFFDTFSGISGDMTISALLDIGVPLLVIERAVAALNLEDFHLHRGHAHKSAIVATSFSVHVEAPHPQRDFAQIDALLIASSLDTATKDLARRIFRKLAEAEALVHRTPIEQVHFHEVGAVDAIVDIVGAAAALTYVGAKVVATPLPMGRGFVKTQHGMLPNPPPAVVECLRGVPTYEVEVDSELVTPTGAAIIATVAEKFVRWPNLTVDRVGYGAGTRDLPDRPNLLRLVLGSTSAERQKDATSVGHVVLEANVDDITGELAAYTIETLLDRGALDAWAVPIIMKKGRPGLLLGVLVAADREEEITSLLLRESTTIGVRRTDVVRTERPRRVMQVTTQFGEIRIKVSEGPFGPPQVKPEYDDCVARAKEHNVPLREVIRAALAAADHLTI